ncbi:DUF3859 domain-containing protein [Massilia sp. METH4]|uniref:DUF3859 domain-containing protein n=1 Tax=Massilia sp. METH4 TaxID=3123041 RepID=UPI0030D52FF1
MLSKANTEISTYAVLFGICLSIGGASTLAPAADLLKIVGQQEIWSGVYEGELDWFHVPRLLKQTDHVPGRLGISFGTYFTLQTEPANAGGIVRLSYKTIFPAPGMRDPRTGETTREIEGVTECILGKACLAGYTFDTPNEILPGEWRLVVSFRNEELLSKSFTVESVP